MRRISLQLPLTVVAMLCGAVLIGAVTVLAAETVPGQITTAAMAPAATSTAPAPAPINWTGADLDSHKVQVPADGKLSVVLFAMAGQEQSAHALKDVQAAVAGRTDMQIVAVVSGQDAAARARGVSEEAKWTWPVVADADYTASGKMGVHVWPTTLIVNGDGKLIVHLAGYPASYARDLAAWLDFAAGKIDAAALDARLAEHKVVAGSADDIANRHLQLAERLLDQGQVPLARQELDKGLASEPDNSALRLLLVRVQLLQGDPAEALKTLDTVDAKSAAAWKLNTLRGWALIKQEKWEQAQTILIEALKLNPAPAEARYLLGLVCQHQGDFRAAADHFRSAFEHTPAGKALDAGK